MVIVGAFLGITEDGVELVVITPDVHYGYGVPVGCVILTDASSEAVAMGPVGYDIGCGMMSSAQSGVSSEQATPQKNPLNFSYKLHVPSLRAALLNRIHMKLKAQARHAAPGRQI